ncbi:hypothetical protein [Microbacterium rhizomatis]|nr:hypothetical protein [Microbacterium rhizomatis]
MTLENAEGVDEDSGITLPVDVVGNAAEIAPFAREIARLAIGSGT